VAQGIGCNFRGLAVLEKIKRPFVEKGSDGLVFD
jgi:hypothetical protein